MTTGRPGDSADGSGSGDQPPGSAPPPGAGGVPPHPPVGGQPPFPPGPQEQGAPRQGSIERQEPGVTQPRPPTVAEARARDKARKRAEETKRAAASVADAKRRTRNRVLIGGVAVVGVAGLVGGGYLAYRALTAPDRVTASCVQINENGQEVVVEDKYCQPGQAGFVDDDSSRGHGGGIVVLGGWPQYRYYYGGSTTVGKAPTGATTVRPKGAEIKTKTGTTIQRGGLGSKSTGGGS
ncbi:hypothetical protein [Nocardia arizonensis]|uniref:hypothetical protein n=1 Tax=Nocardia arizonensis TaxID=1141647 RepID=UPI000ACE2ACC|nr:hypothetical protein [Nocardia arizonensis]